MTNRRSTGPESSASQASSPAPQAPAPVRRTRTRPSRETAARPVGRTYVVDTSVLLADPAAFTRFAEHDVVLPLVVISELEAKRNHPELGYFARAALRRLDELRVKSGRLDAPDRGQ